MGSRMEESMFPASSSLKCLSERFSPPFPFLKKKSRLQDPIRDNPILRWKLPSLHTTLALPIAKAPMYVTYFTKIIDITEHINFIDTLFAEFSNLFPLFFSS